MNQSTIPLLIGVVAGIVITGLVTIWEYRLKKRKKDWVIPLSIVSVLALICVILILFRVNWQDLYNRNPYPFYGLLATIATFAALRPIASMFGLGKIFVTGPNQNKTADDEKENR